MISVSSASDIFCTSAVWKSWAPSFFPIAEPLPSALWQAAHFALYRVSDAVCARADKERGRTTVNAVARVNTSILFIFKLHSSYGWPAFGRKCIYQLQCWTLCVGGSVTRVTVVSLWKIKWKNG